ncbi:MAG: hypothetical protein IT299_11165 [Dehalococcoidia bacterium]|nr:hypothetical protein [Dehalococcoidia bacterium]
MTNTANSRPSPVRLFGTALAALAGVVYLTIGLGIAGEDFKSPPPPVMLAAGVSYLVGGGLILVADRRLLLVGAVVNAVVIMLFLLSVARDNATTDALSLSGKAAQIALGVLLVWAARRRSPETNARIGAA